MLHPFNTQAKGGELTCQGSDSDQKGSWNVVPGVIILLLLLLLNIHKNRQPGSCLNNVYYSWC